MVSENTLGYFLSWIFVLLVGFGLNYANSHGGLSSYSLISNSIIIAGLGLGTFYLATNLLKKTVL